MPSLQKYNSFNLDTQCNRIKPIYSVQDLYSYLDKGENYRILGGGSNVLLGHDIDGDVLLNRIKGIEIIDENDDQLMVRVGGGEIWHQFVMWSVSHGLYGIENLALIPGSVGAAPIQNIGAYGVEQCDSFHSLSALDLEEGVNRMYYNDDCSFGYRDSIFKRKLKGKVFITHVTYLLSKKPQLHTAYGAIQERLKEKGLDHPSSYDMAITIAEIRKSKLPDPVLIPNSGSFFKNPVVEDSVFESLQEKYPTIKSYPLDGGMKKIPAAWLIENAGLKGYRIGDAAIYDNHALILVNHGNATGADLVSVAHHVQDVVQDMYGINLEPEVNIW